MQPQVRDLQALIDAQNASIAPQQQLIDESINSNDNSGQAQVQGLDAAKTNAFKGIEQTAQNKGMFFSGFSPDAQAAYTSSTYLPALAQLQGTIAQTRAGLLGKKADLTKGAFDSASKQHDDDLAVLNDWNKMTAQQQFQASQADQDRAFQAQQNLQKISADAAQAGAGRAADAPNPKAQVAAALTSATGSDGFVSPGTYSALKSQWVASGDGNAKDFDATFAGYRNPKNKAYKLG